QRGIILRVHIVNVRSESTLGPSLDTIAPDATVSIDLTQLCEDELLDLNRRIVERLRLMRSARQLVELAQFTVGIRVEFTTHDGVIEATVMGSEAYSVVLQPTDDTLAGSFTCSYFCYHLAICKHIWATILAAVAKGIPLVSPGRVPAAICLEPLEPDGDPLD